MKKNIIVIIFLIGINFNSISQDVTVKMVIQKERTKSNRWRGYKSDETPFLLIKYINNTDEPIYFRSGFKNFDFSWNGLTYANQDEEKVNLNSYLGLKKNNNYTVDIFPFIWSSYCIVNNPNDTAIEKEEDFVNFYLGELYHKFYKDYKKQDVLFIHNTNVVPLTESNILGRLKEYFIFLKKGESYIVKYDLTGFQILGGNYTFDYYNKQTENFVETTSSWDENQKKWIYKKEPLPLEVNGYKLYQGDIKINKVNVSFD
jgi:hypothetical protein